MTVRRDQITRRPETAVNIDTLPSAGDQLSAVAGIEADRERRRREKLLQLC